MSDKVEEDSEFSSSQCFPLPQEDLPPLSLPLEDLPPLLPLLPLPADFPPGGSAGSAGRCEPEAVAPELAPDPASLGGELGSVDDAGAPEKPPLGLLLECFRAPIHLPRPSRTVNRRVDCQQERYMRIVIPVVQEVVGRGGIKKPL